MNKRKQSFVQTIKKLIQPIFPVKKYRFCRLGGELYDAIQAIFIAQIVASIIASIQGGMVSGVIRGASLFLAIKLIANIMGPFLEIASDKGWLKMESFIMKRYLKKYIHLDNNKVESIGTGKMNTIISEGVGKRVELNMQLVINALVDGLGIIYALVLVFIAVPFLYFLSIIGLFVVSFVIMQYGYKKTEEIRNNVAEIDQDIGRKRIQIIMSKFEILQNNKVAYENEKLNTLYEKVVSFRAKGDLVAEGYTAVGAFLLYAIHAIMYLVVGVGVIGGKYSVAQFVLMIGILNVIEVYVWNIRRYIRQYNKDIIPVRQLWKTFSSIPAIQEDENLESFLFTKGDFVLKEMSFAYNNTFVFKDFSLMIEGGKKTAFVGPSGGGKTTLIKLLAGYIAPDHGNILVDNQDMNMINIQSYYAHIGYLTQDPSVFDGTILENLTYGISESVAKQFLLSPLEKNKQIKHILSSAKCDFVWALEKGRDTEIGERGIRLSGGQKQRLAIAKIMLKDPKIIFLDEPTSAMDSFNEEEVTQALHNLFKGRTVVVVAHRLQTVKQADKIYYLEGGENGSYIVESGTHAELVKLGGKYKKMLNLQSGF